MVSVDDGFESIHLFQELHCLLGFTESDVSENVGVIVFGHLVVEVRDKSLVHVIRARVLAACCGIVLDDIFMRENEYQM